jgi:hypothetical protein
MLSSLNEIRRSLPLGIFIHTDQVHLAIEQDMYSVIQMKSVVRYSRYIRGRKGLPAVLRRRFTEFRWQIGSERVEPVIQVHLDFLSDSVQEVEAAVESNMVAEEMVFENFAKNSV